MNDTNSLAHTKWNCKYHIVFAMVTILIMVMLIRSFLFLSGMKKK